MNSDITANKPLGKKTKRGILWSFVNEGVTELLFFPASMIVARLLTPREFGIAAAAGFFTLLAGRLSELGFNAALIRAKVLREEHLSTVFVINVVVGILTFGVLVAIAPLVSDFYNTPEAGAILPVAAIGFLIVPFGTIPAALLSRDLKFREMTMTDWFQTAAFATVSTVMAWLGFSYMSMVYGRLASLVAQTLARLWYAPWRPRWTFSRDALREIFGFGAGVHAKRLLDYAAQNVDNLIVGRFFGMATLGLYDKAFSTMNRALARLNTAGPGLTFRVFAVINEEPQRFQRAYQKIMLSTTLVAYPIFGVLIVVATPLMVVLFGPQWLPAAVPFQVLCIGGCLKLINTYASSAVQSVGRVWSEVWRSAAYVGIMIAGLFALRAWGAVGAATAVLGATAAMTALMHILLTRVTHIRWFDLLWPQVPALACSAWVMTIVVGVDYVLRGLQPNTATWIVLGAQVLAAVVSYAAFVLFAPIASLRALVREVTEDLAPPFIQRHRWVRAYLGLTSLAEPAPSSSLT